MDRKTESPRIFLILGSLFLIAYAAFILGSAWIEFTFEESCVEGGRKSLSAVANSGEGHSYSALFHIIVTGTKLVRGTGDLYPEYAPMVTTESRELV